MANTLEKASIDIIKDDLENLSRFNSTPGEGITRILFTEEELNGRAYIKSRMKELGLSVSEDSIGNIFGKLEGTNPELSPVWTGSHIDTVLHGGQFDGTVGVIGGMEAIRLIKESGLQHKRDIEVIVFTSEEPTRFGMGCLGSRALAGVLSLEETKNLLDKDMNSLYNVLKNMNYDLSKFDDIKIKEADVYSFLELHIEQGAVLESLGIKTGVVTTISAPTDMQVKVKGNQGHAGATPMYMRSDALTAASKIILELEDFARASKDPSTVATVGKIKVYPGASNVIPGEVDFTIDIRSSDFEEKNTIMDKLRHFLDYISSIRGVKITTETVCHDRPMKADKHIVELIQAVCDEMNLEYNLMVSGAYHDSMLVGQFAPFGMIFVPSKGGISHDKNEWTNWEDIAIGVDVLTKTLLLLSNEV